jgi:magnesium chelatase subunit D
MNMTNQYPFTAIVGQEKLKKALLLCAVNPAIGGVLIKGEKGTAKSTAVRGLSEVMPLVVRESNSLFDSEQYTDDQLQTVPFVDLPLGASEDRVLGSLDLQAIVAEKKKKFLPGLLAAAHKGILYIDEVNLLQDHLVDILLDVSASGVNTVQREGMSVSHPSKFILIGTMNPEEGNLRPQFLDRFGLMVEVESQMEVSERTEVVRRRMAFENNQETFSAKWEAAQLNQQKQIARAQQLLPDVTMPDGLLNLISQLCIEWSVFSLRADIVMYKTAITLAAMAGRKEVISGDIREAAELVLLHRRGKKPAVQPKPQSDTDAGNQEFKNTQSQNKNELSESADNSDSKETSDCGEPDHCAPTQIFAVGQETEVPELKSILPTENPVAGRRSKVVDSPKGFQVRSERKESATNIDYSQTIQQAIVRNPDELSIQKEDIHQKIRHGKSGNLILFVVDASGSMAAAQRMEAVKGSVLSLLKDAYQKRDMVGVIAFRGVEAEVILEPTFSIDLAERALESLPTGGRTPLAHALQLTVQVLNQNKNSITPLLVILSDGKANVPLPGGGDAWKQVIQLSGEILTKEVSSLVLDTEQGYLKFGRAAELAAALGGECMALDSLSAEVLTSTVLDRMEV